MRDAHGPGSWPVRCARQQRLDRVVALKILAPDIAGDPAFAERFTREAQALVRLSHPGIVTVHDFGETAGLYYLVMEFVDGIDLRQLLQDKELTPKRALEIVPRICEALQFAHDHGVVHRDIKPENVLISTKGEIKIADFGLAKLIQPDASLSMSLGGQVVGTPAYMAPEQIEHPGSVDHRADIYSLGVVFYEMLTGELPLGRFEPPSQRADVDDRLDDVVLRALEKQREQRYQRADEIKRRITQVESAQRSSAAQSSSSQPAMAPVAASPAETSAPPPAAPRLSRLALAGFLTSLAGLLFQLLIAAMSVSAARMSAGMFSIAMLGMVLVPSVLCFLAGIGMSIAGWVVVVRSRGRLRGLGFAVVGTFLPLVAELLTSILLPLVWMAR